MSLKKWFRTLHPIKLYVVLVLTIIFFIPSLICSYKTHSLTLSLDAYHVLCNILSLTGCLMAGKYEKKRAPDNEEVTLEEKESLTADNSDSSRSHHNQLKNTFGWARIGVVSMLIYCVFLVALSFSVVVEALQILVHIDHKHKDAMHHPIWVLIVGGAGLLLNGVCFLLIGGYTFHHGNFVYVMENGDVVLSKIVVSDTINTATPSKNLTTTAKQQKRHCFMGICRDVLGAVFVIICALIVYATDDDFGKLVDPIVALISAASLMYFSFPHLKESCLILLQTIPGSIDIELLRKDLLQHFPDIINVHDFHVWQLTTTKIISTVHIIFVSPVGYEKLLIELTKYFLDNGITQVTIQPEFLANNLRDSILKPDCLMPCAGQDCQSGLCCPKSNPQEVSSH